MIKEIKMWISKQIATKYRVSGRQLMLQYQKASIKLVKTNNRMKFWLNCRKCKVIPKCLDYKVRLCMVNERSQRELENIVFKHKIRIMSIMVADAKRALVEVKHHKKTLCDKMVRWFEKADVIRIRNMVENKSVVVHTNVKVREMRKIESLKNRKINTITNGDQWIENTTNTSIPDFLERTLKLGPNFNIQNEKDIPYVEVVSELEKAIHINEKAEEIRTEVATAMINYINFKSQPRHHELEWISKDIAKSKRFLRENPNLLITKADKGNKIVITAAEEYHNKMLELLGDENTYIKLKTDPTTKILKKIGNLLDGWKERKYIDSRTHRRMKVSSCNPPRIYGLPKIHKNGRPLRPVVSTIGSATYNIAKFLANIIGKIVGKTEYHVVNSFEFAEQIAGTKIPEEVVLFSLDVISLYTNVPVDYALECLNIRWQEVEKHTNIERDSFLIAVKLVLESTFFVYRGTNYAQTYGVPMGSPLSPVIANLVMERLEQQCMSTLTQKQIQPKMYRRYVDDCFCVAEERHIDEILKTFNDFHSKIQFTLELETENNIKFLDLRLTRNKEQIEKAWEPKQNDGRYLDFKSESPYSHKCNTAIALIDRAIKLSDSKNRPQALRKARNILRINHYPVWFVNKMVKRRVDKHYNSMQITRTNENSSTNKFAAVPYVPGLSEKLSRIMQKNGIKLASKPKDKIKHSVFSKLKDPIPPSKQTNVVYSIPCGTNDEKVYIGQTGRRLETRIAEHKNDAKKKDARTGLSQHTLQDGHIFAFDQAQILERIQDQESRATAEMFHIKIAEANVVNLQRERGTFNAAYNGLAAKLRKQYAHRKADGRSQPTAEIGNAQISLSLNEL